MRELNVRQWLKRFFRDRVFAALAIITLASSLGVILSVAFPRVAVERENINTSNTVTVGDLFDGESLTLNFRAAKAGLKSVSFVVSAEGREISSGQLHVRLMDESGNVLFEKDIDASSLQDNKSIDVSFPKLLDSGGKEYTVLFSTSGLDQVHAISFWANTNIIEGVSTSLNGQTCDNMVFSLVYVVVYPYYNYRYAFDFSLLAAFFMVLTVVSYGRKKSED